MPIEIPGCFGVIVAIFAVALIVFMFVNFGFIGLAFSLAVVGAVYFFAIHRDAAPMKFVECHKSATVASIVPSICSIASWTANQDHRNAV